jgi:hypothetical protein
VALLNSNKQLRAKRVLAGMVLARTVKNYCR